MIGIYTESHDVGLSEDRGNAMAKYKKLGGLCSDKTHVVVKMSGWPPGSTEVGNSQRYAIDN